MREQTISPNDKLKQALQSFDQNFDTLIDYFAIIGFDNVNGQLRSLINELLEIDSKRGPGRGLERQLQASMLERFPNVDRPKAAFPTELVGFFLENEEAVLTLREVNDIKRHWLQALQQNPDELCQQEVCTGVDGTIIYITTHMFFEDLA